VRERLVAAFVGLTIIVIALYGVPRAYFLADLVRDQEQDRLDRTAELVAATIGEHQDASGPVDTDYLDGLAAEGERIELVREDGEVVGTSDWSEPAGADISAATDVPGGGTVTVARDGDEVDDRIAQALLPLVVLGLLLVVLAGAAGYFIARRIAGPFQELATAARGLGAGKLEPDLPDYRVPEAREIATALTASGEQLAAMLKHERELTVHASHELRTPVTALRLELEDLALWPQTPPDVAAELQRAIGELDRLSTAITELLAASRDRLATAEIDLDLDALIADTVARVAALGRRVTHVPTGRLPTRLDPLPVVQALEMLVGGGSEVRATDRGTHLEVSVTTVDQDPAVASRQRGMAAELVAAAGGSLTQSDGGVLLSLPKRPLEGS
jgi:signal transduction histidine kinase